MPTVIKRGEGFVGTFGRMIESVNKLINKLELNCIPYLAVLLLWCGSYFNILIFWYFIYFNLVILYFNGTSQLCTSRLHCPESNYQVIKMHQGSRWVIFAAWSLFSWWRWDPPPPSWLISGMKGIAAIRQPCVTVRWREDWLLGKGKRRENMHWAEVTNASFWQDSSAWWID